MLERRTKIVATIGPATESAEMLDRLIVAGVDCMRINCSHGDPGDIRRRAADARAAAERAQRPLGLLFDLQGPKLRLAADTASQEVKLGDATVFAGTDATAGGGAVVVSFDGFSELVADESQLVIGDGVPRFAVERVEAGRIHTRALTPGTLASRKGINVTYARPNLPAITEKDAADLALAAEVGADFVALSFVRSAADMMYLRELLDGHGSRARTIAKIEKIEAYEDLDAILAVTDAIMVARGDYGIEAGVARVPLMQKDAIARATRAGKAVITATQMLESMIHSPEPTRAEAADVANAVIDGTSAVMLSAETGVGAYPVEAVLAMSEIAMAAEEAGMFHGCARGEDTDTAAEKVLRAAVELAKDIGADALIVPSATGGSPRACSKYRPTCPIIALAHDPEVGNQLQLEWGVYPVEVGIAANVEELIEASLATSRDVAGLAPGACVVVTAGRATETPGATSMVMVREVPERAS